MARRCLFRVNPARIGNVGNSYNSTITELDFEQNTCFGAYLLKRGFPPIPPSRTAIL
jgi:hypothetical protein